MYAYDSDRHQEGGDKRATSDQGGRVLRGQEVGRLPAGRVLPTSRGQQAPVRHLRRRAQTAHGRGLEGGGGPLLPRQRAPSVITFAVYPDTQNEVYRRHRQPVLRVDSQWLVRTTPLLAIRYVTPHRRRGRAGTPPTTRSTYGPPGRRCGVLQRQDALLAAASATTTPQAVGVGGSAARSRRTPQALVRDTTTFNTYLAGRGCDREGRVRAGQGRQLATALFTAGGV